MKSKLFLLTAALCCVLVSSCQKETYSCDPQIDRWAKKELPNLQELSRAEWSSIECTGKQVAAFATFSPEKKQLFWEEKIDELLNGNWNDKELFHIKKLKDFMDTYPWVFDSHNRTDAQNDIVDKFEYIWVGYAMDELCWDGALIYAMTNTAIPLNNKSIQMANLIISGQDGLLNSAPSTVKTRSEIDEDLPCTCRSASLTGNGHCVRPKCKVTYNCGIFGTSECIGRYERGPDGMLNPPF